VAPLWSPWGYGRAERATALVLDNRMLTNNATSTGQQRQPATGQRRHVQQCRHPHHPERPPDPDQHLGRHHQQQRRDDQERHQRTTTIAGNIFNNNGTVEAATGTIAVQVGGTHSGDFQADSGAAIIFTGGTQTFTTAAYSPTSGVPSRSAAPRSTWG